MTISSELMSAILAMDSYNQGYGAGIEHGALQIGMATKLETPANISEANWQAAGFPLLRML